jgi:hypothetical protein
MIQRELCWPTLSINLETKKILHFRIRLIFKNPKLTNINAHLTVNCSTTVVKLPAFKIGLVFVSWLHRHHRLEMFGWARFSGLAVASLSSLPFPPFFSPNLFAFPFFSRPLSSRHLKRGPVVSTLNFCSQTICDVVHFDVFWQDFSDFGFATFCDQSNGYCGQGACAPSPLCTTYRTPLWPVACLPSPVGNKLLLPTLGGLTSPSPGHDAYAWLTAFT